MRRNLYSIFLIIILLFFLPFQTNSQRREERRNENNLRELIIGVWEVEIGEHRLRIRVNENLTVTDLGENRGKIELIDPNNILIIFKGREKGFEVRFEGENFMFARKHDSEKWVRCVRVR